MPRKKHPPQEPPARGQAPACANHLALHSTDELLDELRRRSLGLILCVVTVDDGLSDVWRFDLRGSKLLLSAMSASLDFKVNREINEQLQREGRT